MDVEEKISDAEQGAAETQRQGLSGRVAGFVRRRPIISLGILAGAGALGGIEWAAGALLGLGAAALVATPAGRELRQRWRDQARKLMQHDHPHMGSP